MNKAVAIILAAGQSKRFGQSKAFFPLAGSPLIARVASTFASHPAVSMLVVVCRRSEITRARRLLEKTKLRKPCIVIAGGATRQISCRRGLQAVAREGTDLHTPILITNVANPWVTHREITAVLRAARSFDTVAVGRPVTSTVKKVSSSGKILHTIPRTGLWVTETPQCMSLRLGLTAHDAASRARYHATDDVELVERLGRKRIAIIPASPRNRKITTPVDLHA